jgi:hypothetical protein
MMQLAWQVREAEEGERVEPPAAVQLSIADDDPVSLRVWHYVGIRRDAGG